MRAAILGGLLLVVAIPALPCACVEPIGFNARTAMSSVSIVFSGTVLKRETLPPRAEMKGRNRYAITFHVDEYWKGSPAKTVVIYGMDGGGDCLGDGGYLTGKQYLVYASRVEAKDVVFEAPTFFWYGWADILPAGTKMLVPETACMPGGEIHAVSAALHELGKGGKPSR